MMLTIGLLHRAFIMMRYIPSIPTFIRAFIMKWCWVLSNYEMWSCGFVFVSVNVLCYI
jgi:hypothetical protein